MQEVGEMTTEWDDCGLDDDALLDFDLDNFLSQHSTASCSPEKKQVEPAQGNYTSPEGKKVNGPTDYNKSAGNENEIRWCLASCLHFG